MKTEKLFEKYEKLWNEWNKYWQAKDDRVILEKIAGKIDKTKDKLYAKLGYCWHDEYYRWRVKNGKGN